MPSQGAAGGTGETVKVKVISNLILMPGYVNDSARLDVVLDTGASENILMPDLKLNSTATGQVAGIGRGHGFVCAGFTSAANARNQTRVTFGQVLPCRKTPLATNMHSWKLISLR
jgi:hypothetical protein